MKNEGSSADREVLGLELIAMVREAFAFGDPIFLLSNQLRISVEIIGFDDADTRELSKERFLELLVPGVDYAFEQLTSVTIEILTKRFKLSFQATVVSSVLDSITVKIPNTGIASNVRKSSRVQIKGDNLTDAIIVSKDQIHACLLKFLDITTGALGAKIFTDYRLDSSDGLLLQTHFKGEDVVFSGTAKIVRLQEVGLGKNHFEYLVGLEPLAEKKVLVSKRASRFEIVTALHCVVVSSNTPITLDISDISTSGFLASKCVPTISWITSGVTIRETSTGLLFTISRIDDSGKLAASLFSPDPESKIKWSNFILPLVNQGRISASSPDARELVNVFLEAGGSIAENLAYKRHAVRQSKAHSVLTTQSTVLLRCVNVSASGAVLGHQSSYRVGLNSWFTGDIVGGQSKHKKIDSTFVRSNFTALKELLLGMQTPQAVFGSWKEGHPYWQKFRDYLLTEKHALFIERYDHISRSLLCSNLPREVFNDFSFKNILSLRSKELGSIIEYFHGTSTEVLLGALDITKVGLFFNGLEAIYSQGKMQGFRRELHTIQGYGSKFLLLLSQLPDGVSINGVFDTVFVFPLSEKSSFSIEQKKNIYSSINAFALSRGFRVVSIRSFMSSEECLGLPTELVVWDAEGMEFFSK